MATSALKLPPALERFVADQVKQGAYSSREAAIIAAVVKEKRRTEQRAWLQTEIQKGLESGPAVELNMEHVIRRGRARLASRKRRARTG